MVVPYASRFSAKEYLALEAVPDPTWTIRELQGEDTCTLGNGAVLDLAKLYRLVPGLETT